MKRRLKRVLSILLVAAMIFCTNATYAFAEEITIEDEENLIIEEPAETVVEVEPIEDNYDEAEAEIIDEDSEEIVEEDSEVLEEYEELQNGETKYKVASINITGVSSLDLRNPNLDKLNVGYEINPDEDFLVRISGGGLETKVEYSVGEDTTKYELNKINRLVTVDGYMVAFTGYCIPKLKLIGDINLYIEARDYYKADKISFNKGGCSVQYYTGSDWTNLDGDSLTGPFDYNNDLRFKLIPGPTVMIAGVDTDYGNISEGEEEGEYYLSLEWLESDVENITVSVTLGDLETKGMGYVSFDPEAEEVVVTDNLGNELLPCASETTRTLFAPGDPDSTESDYIPYLLPKYTTQNTYVMDKNLSYILKIKLKSGYRFGEYGVRVGEEYTHQNSSEDYVKEVFEAGDKISATFVEVLNTPVLTIGEEPVESVGEVFNVDYSDKVKFEIMYGNKVISPDYICLKLGTDIIDDIDTHISSNIVDFAKYTSIYNKVIKADMYMGLEIAASVDIHVSGPIKPTWASKTPTATLTSASDVALTFKVGAPSGESFVGGNYYVGVGLVKNNNTEKGLKEGLVIDDVHEEFIKIKEDGTIPEITINPFRDDNVDGPKVTKLGKGCGTSMNAVFCIVMTDGDAPDNGGKVLAITDVKKCKTITAATKAPYYADKITLKKVNTNLYAGDEKVVATVDFGKNTTFATSDYWEITNKDELEDGYYITVEKSGTNGILVKTSLFDTAPGTYPIKVETVAEGGITAKASINFTVLPTATYIGFYYPIAIYRKSGKTVSYTVPIEVQDLNNDVIKKPSLKYEIGKSDDDFGEEWPPSIENVEGLSVDNKGRITIAKSFEVDTSTQYVLKTTSTTNEEVVNYALVKIIENNINPAGFTFPEKSKTLTLEPETMTLREYYDLGWEPRIYYADSFPATFDKNVVDETLTPDPEGGLEGCGVVITDSEGKAITRDLLKEVKIPNPMYIKKAGKVTLSATTIDGEKISKTINIVKDDTPDVYDTLYVWDSETYNDPVVLAPDATKEYNLGVGAVYSLWLSKGVNPTVWDDSEQAYVFDWNYMFDTKYSMSGDKLTVKGAKIVSNIHDDCIDIVLTSSKATITRKRGSKTIATYYITNSAFNLDMPKITCDNNKVYAKTDRTQKVYYTFDKAYGTYSPELNASTCKYVNITSTNKAFLSYLDCGISISPCYNPDPLTRVELTVNDDAAQIMKAGTYTFTMELLDNNRKALCKPVKATLKVENLKKKLKYKNKYTMSNKDVTGFFLEYSGADCCESNGEGVRLLNDNIKGKYNNITEYFKVEYVAPTECLISLKDGKELPDVKSMTGYVEFWANYVDGTSELRCEKITIKISKSQVYKYKADSPKVALANKANPIENIAIYGNNNQMEIAQAAALDAKTADLLATDEGLIIENGKLTIKLNPNKITKAGKITLKVNVIPSTSVYKSQDVSAENSIPVSITITFTK